MSRNTHILRQLCQYGFLVGISAGLLLTVIKLNFYKDSRVLHIWTPSKESIPILFDRSNEGVTNQSYKQMSSKTKSTIRFTMKPHPWFQENLPSQSEVRQWSSYKLDSELHHLSLWSAFDGEGWRAFVKQSITKLDPPMSKNRNFTFFEVGVGVGAFSRRLLIEFPHARGIGVDLAQAAIAIAQAHLPKDRMKVYVVSTDKFDMIDNNMFDHIIGSGVLCYLPSLSSVKNLLKELVRIAKPGASMSFTMLPFEDAGKYTCNLVILPSFWSRSSIKFLGIRVTSLQNMSEWNLLHSTSRYSVFLRKSMV